jgi:hypothetical protein
MKTKTGINYVRQSSHSRQQTGVTDRRTAPRFTAALLGLSLVCALGPATLASEPSPPDVVIGPYVAARFAAGFPFHGSGGDQVLLFGVQPAEAPDSEPGIHVALRATGVPIGRVTPPPAGWRVPLSIELNDFSADGQSTQGSFVVLDAGVEPAQAGTAPAYLHRYGYSYSPSTGLVTTWRSSHQLPLSGPPGPGLPTGLLAPAGFVLLPEGAVAVTDTALATIWVAGPSFDDWRLAMIDARFAPAFGVADLVGVGRAPGGGTRPYTVRLPSVFPGGPPVAPGIHSITCAAKTDEVIPIVTAPPGGIYAIARSVLLNDTIPPFAKSSALRTIVAPQVGLSDLTDGVIYDRFHPDTPWVYWQRSISDMVGGSANILRRAHLLTGEIQEVARSNKLYDWTSNLSVLPPLGNAPFTIVLSAMGQEENNPDVNILLTAPQYVAPSLLTGVTVSSW